MAQKKQITEKKRRKGKRNDELADGQGEKQPSDVGSTKMRYDRYQSLLLILLIAVGIIIYGNTFNAPFTFDDIPAIEENHSVRMTELSARNMISGAIGYSGNRPASMLSFALNYYFGRYNVVGYHLANIIIHIANAILLWIFLKITLEIANQQKPVTSRLGPLTITSISFSVALVWVAHPLQTQSVTYIVQRMNSMGAMFFVLSLLLYVRGRMSLKGMGRYETQDLKLETQNSRSESRKPKAQSPKHYFWFAGSGLTWLLALGCKQNAATLPFFVFLYEWYFFQDLSKKWLKQQVRYIVGIGMVFGVLTFMYLGLDPLGRIAMLTDYASGEFTIGERALTQLRVVIYYLSLLFYPHPSRLNVDYDFPLSRSLIDPVTTLLCLFVIIGLVGLAVYLAKKDRLLSFCILWFFGNLIIESSLLPLAVIYEHRTYLPSMLVILMAVMLAFRYVKSRPAVIAGLCFVGIVCSLWTYERNKVWSDDVSLWRDCVEKSPRKARPHNNLGLALVERGSLEDGIRHLSEALKLNPYYVQAHNNLGFSLAKQGKLDEAIRHYSEALGLDPNVAEAHNNLGNALLRQGKPKEAIPHYSEALRVKPDYAEAQHNLGVALFSVGDLKEATHHFLEVLRRTPDFAEGHYALGVILSSQGRLKDAIHHLSEAVRVEPSHRKAREQLDALLLKSDKAEEY